MYWAKKKRAICINMERPGDRYVFLQYIKRSNSNNNNDVDEKKNKQTNKWLINYILHLPRAACSFNLSTSVRKFLSISWSKYHRNPLNVIPDSQQNSRWIHPKIQAFEILNNRRKVNVNIEVQKRKRPNNGSVRNGGEKPGGKTQIPPSEEKLK